MRTRRAPRVERRLCPMKRPSIFAFLTIVGALAWTHPLAAQDLVVSNARIIAGTGQIIEQGTIVVRGGRIVSVAAGTAAVPGLTVLDARGMTAVAGMFHTTQCA